MELNNTFYRLPSESAVQTWRATVPAGFRFAVKGSRFITYMKKLKDADLALENCPLGQIFLASNLGPGVFQVIPNWPVDAERFKDSLQAPTRPHRYAFEFQHPSWHTEAI